METSLVDTIVASAPNFIFAVIAVLALLSRLKSQDQLINLLIQKWAECEDDNERKTEQI